MTLKVMRRIAEQQQPRLRHFYQYRLKTIGCRSYHMEFIDESGFNQLYEKADADAEPELHWYENNLRYYTNTSCFTHSLTPIEIFIVAHKL